MASTVGVNASVSLAAGSAGIANGLTVDLGSIYSTPVAAITASAALTAGNLFFQGSLDGTNWYSLVPTIAAATDWQLAGGTNGYKGNSPARFVRVIITTGITGGTVGALVGGGA